MVEVVGASPQVNLKDKPPRKRRIRRLTAGAVLVSAVGIPVSHPVDSFRATKAVFGYSVDCKGDTQPTNAGYKADVLAIPGATSDGIIPNPDGQLRVRAAVERLALDDRVAAEVVLLLGQPRSVDAEANANAYVTFLNYAYTERTGLKLSPNRVSVDKQSLNTAQNMEQLEETMNKKNAKVAEIVTNNSHLPRSILYACGRDIAAYGVSSETIFHKPQSAIDVKEKIEQVAAIYDPKGSLTTQVKRASLYFSKS